MVSPGGDVSAQELKNDQYRPCFSGHETFPLRYGWLQKAYRAVIGAPSPKLPSTRSVIQNQLRASALAETW